MMSHRITFYIPLITTIVVAATLFISSTTVSRISLLLEMVQHTVDMDMDSEAAITTAINKQLRSKGLPINPKISTWEPFNNTNPHQHDWCPYAICMNSPVCTPCDRRWLFIAATGRSASTTLMKMLNLLPSVRFTGENNNQIHMAYETVNNLKGKAAHRLLEQANYGSWMHHTIPNGTMACVSQQIMEAINPPAMELLLNKETAANVKDLDRQTIFGMKEIRFHKGNWTAKQAANYIKLHFPCSRVLGNIRLDKVAHILSLNSTFEKNVQQETLNSYNDFIINFIEELGSDRARLLYMEEWTQSVTVLNEVLEWLGFIDCHYTNIVHENNGGITRDNNTSAGLSPQCRKN